MAAKKQGSKKSAKRAKSAARRGEARTEPKLPYTNTPGALRRFLELVPKKPRPSKVNMDTLRSWGIGDSNAQSIIRVLKAVDLVGANNEPTPTYEKYMELNAGPSALGAKVRQLYSKLFEASKEPYKESNETLRNLFNIHSGGAESTIDLQIQTFKSLPEYSKFDGAVAAPAGETNVQTGATGTSASTQPNAAAVHIDLHIHLPENKSSREYAYMFEDIAKYLFGRSTGDDGRDRE